jgi:BolA protein
MYIHMLRKEEVRERIQNALPDAFVDVEDQGEGHFKVTVVSTRFVGLPLIKRHRVILELFQEDFYRNLHALEVKAITPEEYEARETAV